MDILRRLFGSPVASTGFQQRLLTNFAQRRRKKIYFTTFSYLFEPRIEVWTNESGMEPKLKIICNTKIYIEHFQALFLLICVQNIEAWTKLDWNKLNQITTTTFKQICAVFQHIYAEDRALNSTWTEQYNWKQLRDTQMKHFTQISYLIMRRIEAEGRDPRPEQNLDSIESKRVEKM
jgi:hypothetical protein